MPLLLSACRLSPHSPGQLECYDYADSANPPILHRKETFLHPTHPLHVKFARLTQQEEKAGLLDDPSRIGSRTAWLARLEEHGLTLRGHRLLRANRAAQIDGED
jgi:hypothetical protein